MGTGPQKKGLWDKDMSLRPSWDWHLMPLDKLYLYNKACFTNCKELNLSKKHYFCLIALDLPALSGKH